MEERIYFDLWFQRPESVVGERNGNKRQAWLQVQEAESEAEETDGKLDEAKTVESPPQ